MALALGLEESHLNDRVVSLGVSALAGQDSSTVWFPKAPLVARPPSSCSVPGLWSPVPHTQLSIWLRYKGASMAVPGAPSLCRFSPLLYPALRIPATSAAWTPVSLTCPPWRAQLLWGPFPVPRVGKYPQAESHGESALTSGFTFLQGHHGPMMVFIQSPEASASYLSSVIFFYCEGIGPIPVLQFWWDLKVLEGI